MEENNTLRRIRLLIAKAEGTDNEHEAEAFMAAAMMLMQKYGIEQAMIQQTNKPEQIETVFITCTAPFAREKVELLHVIALSCNGFGYRDTLKSQKVKGGAVYALSAFSSDLERIQMLYTSLLLQSARAVDLAADEHAWDLTGQTLAAWKRTFLTGYKSSVYRKLQDAKKAAIQETTNATSTTLVLLERKDKVALHVKNNTTLNNKSGKRKLTGNGYGIGRIEGRKADVGGTGIANGSAGQLSR